MSRDCGVIEATEDIVPREDRVPRVVEDESVGRLEELNEDDEILVPFIEPSTALFKLKKLKLILF